MSDDQQRESESVADREERHTKYDEGEGERRESPQPESREQDRGREREHEREGEHGGDDDRERDPLKLRSNRLSREEISELERTGHKLFVGNLSYETRVPDMEREFGKYGELKDVFLPMHRMTGQCRGFGFVTYATREGAEEAEKNLNGATMLGRVIAVNFARPRPSGGARRGGFRGRPYRPYFPRAPRYDYGYYSRGGYDAYDEQHYPPAAPGAEAGGYYGYDRRDRYSPYDSRAPVPAPAPAGAPPPPAAEGAYDQRGGYYGSSYPYQGYDDRAYRSTTYEPPRRY